MAFVFLPWHVGGDVPCGLNTIGEVFTYTVCDCVSPEQDIGEDECGKDELL